MTFFKLPDIEVFKIKLNKSDVFSLKIHSIWNRLLLITKQHIRHGNRFWFGLWEITKVSYLSIPPRIDTDS